MFKSSLITVILLVLANAEAQFRPPPFGPFETGPSFGPRPPFGPGSPFEVRPSFGPRPPFEFRPPGRPDFDFPRPRPFPNPRPHPLPHPPPAPQQQLSSLRLCTTTQFEQDKCLYALAIAHNNSIALKLKCVQTDSFDECLQALKNQRADLVVADENNYWKARLADLVPLLYAHESLESYYIAVAPKNITLLELSDASLDVDTTNDRALHAAALFNLRRGLEPVATGGQQAEGDVIIKIIDSADYIPTDDELLVCANGSVADVQDYDYGACNFEASLESAIFASRPQQANRSFTRLLQNVFDTLANRLGDQSEIWNFFSDFEGTSDVIFKNNTYGFSLIPINRNGVTEQKFFLLAF